MVAEMSLTSLLGLLESVFVSSRCITREQQSLINNAYLMRHIENRRSVDERIVFSLSLTIDLIYSMDNSMAVGLRQYHPITLMPIVDLFDY